MLTSFNSKVVSVPGLCYHADGLARSILGLVVKTMRTKFDYQLFAAGGLLKKSEAANGYKDELETLVHKHMQILRHGPGLMIALTRIITEKYLGGIPDGSENIHDKLPPKIGADRAIRWALRVYEGESYEEISANTHSISAKTVAKAVDAAATCIDIDESGGATIE